MPAPAPANVPARAPHKGQVVTTNLTLRHHRTAPQAAILAAYAVVRTYAVAKGVQSLTDWIPCEHERVVEIIDYGRRGAWEGWSVVGSRCEECGMEDVCTDSAAEVRQEAM